MPTAVAVDFLNTCFLGTAAQPSPAKVVVVPEESGAQPAPGEEVEKILRAINKLAQVRDMCPTDVGCNWAAHADPP